MKFPLFSRFFFLFVFLRLSSPFFLRFSVIRKPGDHPYSRTNALGVKRLFSELWESSGYSRSSSRSSENTVHNATISNPIRKN